jgi:acetyltransferase-like isoleucine patch superfamily enzyme
VSLPLAAVNFLFQRVLQVNGDVPWPVHYTSRVSAAKGVSIHPSVKLSFAVSGGCYFQGVNGIVIGEGTVFAPGVKVVSSNHDAADLRAHEHGNPVLIGRHCWIGANAVILPETTLGDHVVVGAGAVVSGSFPASVVLAGVPARIVKHLDVGGG